MNTTYNSNSAGITKYSYGSITAKLAGYIEVNQKVRLINSFAYQDAGRDKANLLFVKQFGVVPQELNSQHGEIGIRDFTSLEAYDGLTIFIESMLVSDAISSSSVANSGQAVNMYKNVSMINFKQANVTGTHDFITEGHINTINQQTQMLARLLETKRKDFRGGYIYISGFSCTSSIHEKNELPEPEFLPWYFELGNMTGMPTIFTQPELDILLKNLVDQPPLIANLDDFLDGVVWNESHT